MTTHHKDDCPCGSGKRYKHCHLPADEARKRRAWTAGLAVVGAVVLGGAAFGMYGQWQAGRAAGGAGDSLSRGGAGGDVSGATAPAGGTFGGLVPGLNQQAPLAQGAAPAVTPGMGTNAVLPGENPKPWEYQVEKDRHYDPRPGHQHWHEGPPPADTSAAAGAAIPTPIVTTTSGSGTPATTTTTISPSFRADLAPGENPAPWEFDAKNNRHFNPQPGHGHWHPGPAPPPGQR